MPRITCLQLRPRATFDAAIEELRAALADIAHAESDLVCLPEYCGGLRTEGAVLRPPSQPEDRHPVLDMLREHAARTGTWMLVGSLAVSCDDDLIRNRSLVIDHSGNIIARYDKIHLFDIQLSETHRYEESAVIAPGDRAVVVGTPAGRTGLSICYDLRFPALYRMLAQAGAEVLMVPAAFTRITGEAHWHVLNRARAIENCAYVVAPCATGPVPGGGECFGHSLVIDPWGRVLADAGVAAGHVTVDIAPELVGNTRRQLPSLEHDRAHGFVCHDGPIG